MRRHVLSRLDDLDLDARELAMAAARRAGLSLDEWAAAVLAALTGADIEDVTGRGGGLTDEGFARKKAVLRRALTRRTIRRDDVLDVLCAVGGLDMAAMTGAFLGCAHEGIPAASFRPIDFASWGAIGPR